MFCFAVNNAEVSNHTFLLCTGHAPLDPLLGLLQTLAMWLQSYTVHCRQHMETSFVQGLTKRMTEFEFNYCCMNIQARERCSYRG
jgi:hypothetical protein